MYRIQIKRSRRLFRNVWLVKKRTNKQKRLHKKIQWKSWGSGPTLRSSDYFLKLRARQYMSQFYGHINWKAIHGRIPGAPRLGPFFHALETRLDVVLYRMKVSPNVSVIKQLISHKKVLVNDQIVNVRNFCIKPGDIISVQPQAAIGIQKLLFQIKSRRYWRRQKLIRFCFRNRRSAPHLEVNFKTMTAVLCTKPRFVRLPYVDDYKRLPFK
jgi:ribosomal protein S4